MENLETELGGQQKPSTPRQLSDVNLSIRKLWLRLNDLESRLDKEFGLHAWFNTTASHHYYYSDSWMCWGKSVRFQKLYVWNTSHTGDTILRDTDYSINIIVSKMAASDGRITVLLPSTNVVSRSRASIDVNGTMTKGDLVWIDVQVNTPVSPSGSTGVWAMALKGTGQTGYSCTLPTYTHAYICT